MNSKYTLRDVSENERSDNLSMSQDGDVSISLYYIGYIGCFNLEYTTPRISLLRDVPNGGSHPLRFLILVKCIFFKGTPLSYNIIRFVSYYWNRQLAFLNLWRFHWENRVIKQKIIRKKYIKNLWIGCNHFCYHK